MTTLTQLKRQMRALGSPAKAANSARFFKTAPGQYGHGDLFLGLTVPQQRLLSRQFQHLALPQLQSLLNAPEHEFRLTALLILNLQYHAADPQEAPGLKTRETLHRFYLANTHRINNWDLVDSSAETLVGQHLLDKDRALLKNLAKSPMLWERRIAMVATFAFIKRADAADALAIATLLLKDEHDLIHKAVGWMLREVGKRVSPATLTGYLDKHHHAMPRTALRYALEHLTPAQRAHYMKR